jgi:septation ring formation regulator EzrA
LTPLLVHNVPQHKFDAMRQEFDELTKRKFENVEREYFYTAAQTFSWHLLLRVVHDIAMLAVGSCRLRGR